MGELRIYQNPNLGKWRNESKEFAITVYAITKNDGLVSICESRYIDCSKILFFFVHQ